MFSVVGFFQEPDVPVMGNTRQPPAKFQKNAGSGI
jgi:hypothetical protein